MYVKVNLGDIIWFEIGLSLNLSSGVRKGGGSEWPVRVDLTNYCLTSECSNNNY